MNIGYIIDISHHQNSVFDDIKALENVGCTGIIHKASEGLTYVDNKYHLRFKKSLETNILWGAYHFVKTKLDTSKQMKLFLETVGEKQNIQNPHDVRLILDWEQFGDDILNSPTVIEIESCCHIIKTATGKLPMIYGNYSFLKDKHISKKSIIASCDLWIAHYTKELDTKVPSPWTKWAMWQYTDGTTPAYFPNKIENFPPCDLNLTPRMHDLYLDKKNGINNR